LTTTITVYNAFAQDLPLSRQMVDSFMANHKDSILVGKNTATKWDYEQGLMLKAIEKVWYRTGEGKYFEYIRKDIDQYVRADGSIRTYRPDEYNIDNIPPGRALLTLYQQSLPIKRNTKKPPTCSGNNWKSNHGQKKGVTGTKSAIPTKCGSMASSWASHSPQNTASFFIIPSISTTSSGNLH
jgi:hypothetical protein